MTSRDSSRSDNDTRPPPEGDDSNGDHDDERSHDWGICSEFMNRLAISGVVISIVDSGGRRSTVAATDVVAARWDEVELEVGAGPLHDAATTTTAQLIPDVLTSALNPLLASHFDDLGVRAAFTFPLTLGSATVGVAGLYQTTPGTLSNADLHTAARLARSVTIPAVRAALRLAAHDGADGSKGTDGSDDLTDTRHAPELRREVHQATGMISAQLDVTMSEAFARLRANAVASERSISAVSRDVVGGGIKFFDLDEDV